MDGLFSPEASPGSLLLATILAATLIPLSSEVALFTVLQLNQDLLWPAIGIATLGNTPGGLTVCVVRACFRLRLHRRHAEVASAPKAQ